MRAALRWSFFLLFFCPPNSFADELDSLIEQSQREFEQWAAAGEDLPPAFLTGAADAVLVWSSQLAEDTANELCHDLVPDELSTEAGQRSTVEVNLSNPQIRERFGDACMVRPGDSLMAIGRGTQTVVVMGRFELRPEAPRCAGEERFSLWGVFDEPLAGAPILFSTNVELSTGPNHFLPFDRWVPGEADRDVLRLVSRAVRFADEYDVKVFEMNAPNVQQLISIKKQTISGDDDGLMNEALGYRVGDQFTLVASVDVDLKKGSGQLYPEGLLDYNGDGLQDLYLRARQSGCLFELFFEGHPEGFAEISLPNLKCGC